MAGRNPFYDLDDDVDDDTFINHGRQNVDKSGNRESQNQLQSLAEERRQIENRTLQSSKAAVRALYETEQVGIGAAVELARQGEQLKNVDRNLDQINDTVKTTQRHLTSMKSMFSGFWNRMGKTGTESVVSRTPTENAPTALMKTLNEVQGPAEEAKTRNHPALKNRLDTSGFGAAFDDDADEETGRKYETRSQMVDQQLNGHLHELSNGMTRLKMLAQGLSSELDDQNELINNLDTKVDIADQAIKSQTAQMNRLLKK